MKIDDKFQNPSTKFQISRKIRMPHFHTKFWVWDFGHWGFLVLGILILKGGSYEGRLGKSFKG